MPDLQSSEPGFESSFATVSKIGHFRSLHWRPSWLSCINEYLAIDSGGNVSDLVLAHNCSIARTLPGEAELLSEWTGLPGRANSVKRFERSNRPDIALYKNYLYLYLSENIILYEFQSGFRSSYSTDTCLIHLTDYIKLENDKSNFTGMIQLDLHKAVDTGKYTILLNKLKWLGADDVTVQWFISYGQISDPRVMELPAFTGVPSPLTMPITPVEVQRPGDLQT